MTEQSFGFFCGKKARKLADCGIIFKKKDKCDQWSLDFGIAVANYIGISKKIKFKNGGIAL